MRRMKTAASAPLVGIALILGCLASGCSEAEPAPAQATRYSDDAEAERVRADLRRTSAAFIEGDLGTVLDFTHPVVIEKLGGRASAQQTIEQAMAQISSQELKLEQVEFTEEPTFIRTATNEFVVVPMRSTFSISGEPVESYGFQIGARPVGTTGWKYVDGAQLDTQNIHQIFPDFPRDFQFPQND